MYLLTLPNQIMCWNIHCMFNFRINKDWRKAIKVRQSVSNDLFRFAPPFSMNFDFCVLIHQVAFFCPYLCYCFVTRSIFFSLLLFLSLALSISSSLSPSLSFCLSFSLFLPPSFSQSANVWTFSSVLFHNLLKDIT